MTHAYVTYQWVTSHMNESHPVWMSHVTCECVMLHTNASCRIWMSCVSFECDGSYMNVSFLPQECHTERICHEWAICSWLIRDSFVTHATCKHTRSHVSETYYIWISQMYEWVVSHSNATCHIWMPHATCKFTKSHISETYYIWISQMYDWVMSHSNASNHTWIHTRRIYDWVMAHMNESCHIRMSHVTYGWGMSHMNRSRHILLQRGHIYPCKGGVRGIWSVAYYESSLMNESCHRWMSHVTYIRVKAACEAYGVSHINKSYYIWMSHIAHEGVVSHSNASCHMWMHQRSHIS